jgi:hypothetical protein
MITQPMMKLAVTGTARPRMASAMAASTVVRASTAVGLSVIARAPLTSNEASCAPRPVLVVVAVMIPAAAQTAVTGSTPRTPADRAVNSRRGVSQDRRSRKDSATASRVAYTTARVALCPSASRTTIRISEEKW